MAFWEESIFHVVWNNILMKTLPTLAESAEIEEILKIEHGSYIILPWIIMGLTLAFVIILDAVRSTRSATEAKSI